jgi:hypothetical protein
MTRANTLFALLFLVSVAAQTRASQRSYAAHEAWGESMVMTSRLTPNGNGGTSFSMS